MKLLDGILVLDFSQYLAGPSCAMRLADMGARVIKVERPGSGDSGRKMTLENLVVGKDSMNFLAINRGKESFCANMKDPEDLKILKALIKKADVMIENFRPGVMKKNGLDYASVSQWNPGIVYATVTGYGQEGPWKTKPGQDLLIQSMSGLAWLNGNGGDPPAPFGLSVVDSYAGTHMAEGILAALIRRTKTKRGGLVEVTLMESALEMQFEGISTYLSNGHHLPVRSTCNNAHPLLGAPYGIYETKDGYIALAMGSLEQLGRLLKIEKLFLYNSDKDAFIKRDEIKQIIADKLKTESTTHWLEILQKEDYWCSDVYSWEKMIESEGFKNLDFLQTFVFPNGESMTTTRCPISVNGEKMGSSLRGPLLGEHTEKIIEEMKLREEAAD